MKDVLRGMLGIVLLLLFFIVIYKILFVSKTCTDGDYSVDIIYEPQIFAMPGGGSDIMAHIILKNKYGIPIGKSSNLWYKVNSCSKDFRWNWGSECVHYTRGNWVCPGEWK